MSLVEGSRRNRKATPAKKNDTVVTTSATIPTKRKLGSVIEATSDAIATIVVRPPNTSESTAATRGLRVLFVEGALSITLWQSTART